MNANARKPRTRRIEKCPKCGEVKFRSFGPFKVEMDSKGVFTAEQPLRKCSSCKHLEKGDPKEKCFALYNRPQVEQYLDWYADRLGEVKEVHVEQTFRAIMCNLMIDHREEALREWVRLSLRDNHSWHATGKPGWTLDDEIDEASIQEWDPDYEKRYQELRAELSRTSRPSETWITIKKFLIEHNPAFLCTNNSLSLLYELVACHLEDVHLDEAAKGIVRESEFMLGYLQEQEAEDDDVSFVPDDLQDICIALCMRMAAAARECKETDSLIDGTLGLLESWAKRDFSLGDPRPHKRGGRLSSYFRNPKSLKDYASHERSKPYMKQPSEVFPDLYRRDNFAETLLFCLPLETYTVDHCVHCVLDVISAVISNAPENKRNLSGASSQEDEWNEYWGKWLPFLVRLQNVAVKGASDETKTAVGEYVDCVRLLSSLQLAAPKPYAEAAANEAFHYFEAGGKPDSVLELYLLMLSPHGPRDYAWPKDLLRLAATEEEGWAIHDEKLYNRAKKRGAFLFAQGLFAESLIRKRCEQHARAILESQGSHFGPVCKRICEVYPELAAGIAREQLRGLGRDYVCSFAEFCWAERAEEHEILRAEVGTLIMRLETRLRCVMASRLEALHVGNLWQEMDLYQEVLEVPKKRFKDASEVHRDEQGRSLDLTTYLDYFTLDELWRFFSDKRHRSAFPSLPETVNARPYAVNDTMRRIIDARNAWAHNRSLGGNLEEFRKAVKKMLGFLDEYERVLIGDREKTGRESH